LLAACLFICIAQSSPLAAQYKSIPPEESERAEKEMCKKVGCAYVEGDVE
jgi:hypothetical protein